MSKNNLDGKNVLDVLFFTQYFHIMMFLHWIWLKKQYSKNKVNHVKITNETYVFDITNQGLIDLGFKTIELIMKFSILLFSYFYKLKFSLILTFT